MTRVRDVLAAIDRAAPFALQSESDNSGLLVGDPAAPVRTIAVALDPTPPNIREARRRRAQCLVTHHPLFWTKLKTLSPDSHVGASVLEAGRAEVALIAAHTNYDNAVGGLNDLLARRLGLRDSAPLRPSAAARSYKVVVFVPAGDLERVQRALFQAGAGHIGDYAECSFRVAGTGTFRGGASTHPTVGRRGRREEVPELRLETVVPAGCVEAVVRALRAAHSYEEPAFDLHPLDVLREGAGLGRVGELKRPESLAAFIRRVKRALGVRTVEVIGSAGRRISRVALVSGGGGDVWPLAVQAGADVYLTGEMKHHDRLAARDGGLTVVLAGHYATEYPAVAGLVKMLRSALPDVRVLPLASERDPTAWR